MAKVMIIAGGKWQCPIVREAKAMGHYVICSNLYKDSPAFAYADAAEVADVLDRERNLEIARKYRPDAVLTDQSDIAVSTVAYVAEQLGLKGIGTEIAERFTNKYRMRQAASRLSGLCPRFRKCDSPAQAEEFVNRYGRSVLKPLDSQSSRGVHVVGTPEAAAAAFQDSADYSHSEHGALIEQYLGGVEFTVDGICTGEDYHVTAISQKEHFSHNPSIASRLFFSRENPEFDYDALRSVNRELVRSMGLPFGQTHAEYKFYQGQYRLIEIAARGGGTRISSDIVPLISGINSNAVYLNTLLGNSGTVESVTSYPYAVLGFFSFPPGRVLEISGLEEAEKQEGVRAVELELQVGDVLRPAADDRSRCGYYILYADSREELAERETLLKRTVQVKTDGTAEPEKWHS